MGLGVWVQKISPPTGLQIPDRRTVASRSTDYAIVGCHTHNKCTRSLLICRSKERLTEFPHKNSESILAFPLQLRRFRRPLLRHTLASYPGNNINGKTSEFATKSVTLHDQRSSTAADSSSIQVTLKCSDLSLSAPCHACRLNLDPSHITLNIVITTTKFISKRQAMKSCSTVIWLG